jgi:hypothetical protein
MTDKELTAFRVDAALLQALRFVKERDGVPLSEQVRRATEAWLKANGADLRDIHRAFDDFDDSLTATENRGDSLDGLRLPLAFGAVGDRALGSLSASEFETVERMATAVGRNNPWYRRCWKKATVQKSAGRRSR